MPDVLKSQVLPIIALGLWGVIVFVVGPRFSKSINIIMYGLLVRQFLKSKVSILAFIILVFLGFISIVIGQQFLQQQIKNVENVFEQQQKHIAKQVSFHEKDLGLLMYYLKFPFINPVKPLDGVSIGQCNVDSNIQNIGILNLEGQKYDTDLVNSVRLQVGNLDLSFVIIFLYPLVIIALSFNLLSEEHEKGIWKMIRIQGKSAFAFLMSKLVVRVVFISLPLLLFILAKFMLIIPFNMTFVSMLLTAFLYILLWFSVCLFVISFNRKSNLNP